MECPICYQDYLNPVCLECHHIFCFLCIKGAASTSRKCPLCRQDIADTTLEEPQIIPLDEILQEDSDESSHQKQCSKDFNSQIPIGHPIGARAKGGHGRANACEKSREEDARGDPAPRDNCNKEKKKAIIKDIPVFENDCQWFYEGRNGWWLYDQRTSRDLETAFKEGKPKIELLIAGHLYVIDFGQMLQYRRNDPNKHRRIKRDHLPAELIKGLAGIKLPSLPQGQDDPESECSKDGQPTLPPQMPLRPDATAVQVNDTQSGSQAGANASVDDDVSTLTNMMAGGLDLNASPNPSPQTSGPTNRTSGRSSRQMRETTI